MVRRIAGIAIVALALAAATTPTGAADSRRHYAYDAAGRLVRVGDGTGRFALYRYDAAGNLLGTVSRRIWQVSVKKPAKGAWILHQAPDGTLDGHGADDQRGFYDLSGSLDPDGNGTLEFRDPDTALVIDTFTLAGSLPSENKKTGGFKSLVFKGPDGISAVGLPPEGALGGFRGSYGNSRNTVKAGKSRFALGRVDFVEEGTRAGVTVLGGALRGLLVRDRKGKAFGEVEYDGTTYRVAAKLKDGARSVKAKTGKGAPVKLLVTVKP